MEREGRPEREAPITALLRQAGSWGVRGAAFYAPLACRSSREPPRTVECKKVVNTHYAWEHKKVFNTY